METIHLYLERKGRRGKAVTLLEGFTHDSSYLQELAGRFKKSCGTGETFMSQTIEVQGDFRFRLRGILLKERFQVKG
jgi:translation initiation factor 1